MLRANSVAWNPHKMLVAGLQCSALLLRDTTVWISNLKIYRIIFYIFLLVCFDFFFFFGSVKYVTSPYSSSELVKTVSQRQCHVPVPARQILRCWPGHWGQVCAVQSQRRLSEVVVDVESRRLTWLCRACRQSVSSCEVCSCGTTP